MASMSHPAGRCSWGRYAAETQHLLNQRVWLSRHISCLQQCVLLEQAAADVCLTGLQSLQHWVLH
jgi:hypothetical protein